MGEGRYAQSCYIKLQALANPAPLSSAEFEKILAYLPDEVLRKKKDRLQVLRELQDLAQLPVGATEHLTSELQALFKEDLYLEDFKTRALALFDQMEKQYSDLRNEAQSEVRRRTEAAKSFDINQALDSGVDLVVVPDRHYTVKFTRPNPISARSGPQRLSFSRDVASFINEKGNTRSPNKWFEAIEKGFARQHAESGIKVLTGSKTDTRTIVEIKIFAGGQPYRVVGSILENGDYFFNGIYEH
jgi:hypothetical protein